MTHQINNSANHSAKNGLNFKPTLSEDIRTRDN